MKSLRKQLKFWLWIYLNSLVSLKSFHQHMNIWSFHHFFSRRYILGKRIITIMKWVCSQYDNARIESSLLTLCFIFLWYVVLQSSGLIHGPYILSVMCERLPKSTLGWLLIYIYLFKYRMHVWSHMLLHSVTGGIILVHSASLIVWCKI